MPAKVLLTCAGPTGEKYRRILCFGATMQSASVALWYTLTGAVISNQIARPKLPKYGLKPLGCIAIWIFD